MLKNAILKPLAILGTGLAFMAVMGKADLAKADNLVSISKETSTTVDKSRVNIMPDGIGLNGTTELTPGQSILYSGFCGLQPKKVKGGVELHLNPLVNHMMLVGGKAEVWSVKEVPGGMIASFYFERGNTAVVYTLTEKDGRTNYRGFMCERTPPSGSVGSLSWNRPEGIHKCQQIKDNAEEAKKFEGLILPALGAYKTAIANVCQAYGEKDGLLILQSLRNEEGEQGMVQNARQEAEKTLAKRASVMRLEGLSFPGE